VIPRLPGLSGKSGIAKLGFPVEKGRFSSWESRRERRGSSIPERRDGAFSRRQAHCVIIRRSPTKQKSAAGAPLARKPCGPPLSITKIGIESAPEPRVSRSGRGKKLSSVTSECKIQRFGMSTCGVERPGRFFPRRNPKGRRLLRPGRELRRAWRRWRASGIFADAASATRSVEPRRRGHRPRRRGRPGPRTGSFGKAVVVFIRVCREASSVRINRCPGL